MKRIFLLTMCLLCAATAAMPQPGVIGVYGDPVGAICDFYDNPGVEALVYVVHTYTPGATGSQFKLLWAGGASMTYLGERVTAPYFGKGTAFDGISIVYGSCESSPNKIMTLHFMGNGDSQACSFLVVVPAPGAESIQVTDCSDPPNLLVAEDDCLVINSDESCPCYIPGWDPCPDIVPVQKSTWGHIKMLYKQLN
ncbi:MAG: hypothetical protein KAJ19_30170 [Gammaproteobacteria bacterium]|nr:hypothetical protein [Gammaproteobacteria bacterium]